MKKNRCVVLGASGFIGGYLVKELLKNSHPVLAVGRNREKLVEKFGEINSQLELDEIDFNNLDEVINLISENDIVFDLISSSVPSTSVKNPLLEIKDNIYPQANFFKEVSKLNINKIIFTSSGGSVYGDMGDKPFKETDLPNPLSPYAISKLTTEYFLNYFCRINKIPFTIFRISNPFGFEQKKVDGFGAIPTFIEHLKKNISPTLFSHGDLVRDFIHVQDVVEAIVLSISRENEYSTYNLGSGLGMKIKEVWETLRKAAGSDLEARYEAKRSFDVQEIVLDVSRFSSEFSWQPKKNVKESLEKMGRSIR
jgi:UDP-glucose 4-epimerase